jgi:cytoplasmic iron level regulating protein YaaA (DUF328/UPF0246 family)
LFYFSAIGKPLKKTADLSDLMSISDKLADLNWKQSSLENTFNHSNARPAVYTLIVYIGLDAYSLPQKKYKFYKIVCVFFRVCMDC